MRYFIVVVLMVIGCVNIIAQPVNFDVDGIKDVYYEHESIVFIIEINNLSEHPVYYDPVYISECGIRLRDASGLVQGGVRREDCSSMVGRIKLPIGQSVVMAKSMNLYGVEIARRIYKRFLVAGEYDIEVSVLIEDAGVVSKISKTFHCLIRPLPGDGKREIDHAIKILLSWQENPEKAFKEMLRLARDSRGISEALPCILYEYAYEIFKHTKYLNPEKEQFRKELICDCGNSFSAMMAYLTEFARMKENEDSNAAIRYKLYNEKRKDKGDLIDKYMRYLDRRWDK